MKYKTQIPDEDVEYAKKVLCWARKKYTVKELSDKLKVSGSAVNKWYYWGGIPGSSSWPTLKSLYEKEVGGEV